MFSDAYPVMIDYERMCGINSDNMAADWLMLVLTSLNTIIQHQRLTKKELSYVFKFLNSMCGTGYMPNRLCNLREVKRWLRRNCNFNNLVTAPKYEIGCWTCMQAFRKFAAVMAVVYTK